MKKYLLASMLCCATVFAYEPGGGIELSDSLKIGGYIALKYENGESANKAMVDDIAVMAYGNLGSHTRYLVELENVGRYERDYKNHTTSESSEFRIERAVVDHSVSSYLNFSLGKMITPVGYWNQTPINVLRDTTSSPLAATNIFPKLITGIQAYGDVGGIDGLGYMVCAQSNRDMDEKYNNFDIDRFIGVGARYEVGEYSEIKVFAASFEERLTDIKRNFVHFAYKYQEGYWQLLSEAAYSKVDIGSVSKSIAGGFLQGRYKLNDKNYAAIRYEYYMDAYEQERQHLGVIGYNYRPIYPVSFKVEYQFSSIVDRSKVLCSVSALF